MSDEKLRLQEKLSYGLGDFASCLYWASFSSILLKFYTDVFGITAAVAGAIFLWSRIWDGINDPIVGSIADRTNTRWGKFRPFLLWGAVPFAIAGVLMFTTPALGMTGRIVWAVVTYNLMMMLYTFVNIPYTSLLGVITPDSAERTKLSSIKFVFAFAAGVVVKITLPYLSTGLGGGDLGRGYQLTFVVYGVVAAALFYLTFRGTRERVAPPAGQKSELGRDIADLVTNGPWLILTATTLLWVLFVSIRGTITAHYLDYYVGKQTLAVPGLGTFEMNFNSLFASFGVLGDAASILGVVLVPFVAARLGKKPTFVVLFAVAIATTAAFRVLAPDQLWAMYALHFLTNVTGGPLCVLLWAMYADTADYGEWKNGRRATGMVFSASTMSQKVGWAVGGFFAGKMLFSTGYAANAVQSAGALVGMRDMMSYYPALAGVAAVVVFLAFPLHERRVAEIAANLKARRGEAAPGA